MEALFKMSVMLGTRKVWQIKSSSTRDLFFKAMQLDFMFATYNNLFFQSFNQLLMQLNIFLQSQL
jgi:hypothetical protein